MGQKVNPHGLRVGIIKDWSSRWYAGKKTYGDTLVEDYKIRQYFLNKTYKSDKSPVPMKPGISNVEIERDASRVKIYIHTAKPGILIGPKGAEIERMRKDIERIAGGKSVNLNIVEITDLDMNAQLVAENIAAQLEQRVAFRRAMKSCIGRTMKSGAKGIKTMVSGRLGGAEIARSESYHEGTIPLQTLRADIDYGVARAATTYGIIGVKVWIYKGEVLKGELGANRAITPAKKRREITRPASGSFGDKRNSGRGGGGDFRTRQGGRGNGGGNSGFRPAGDRPQGGFNSRPSGPNSGFRPASQVASAPRPSTPSVQSTQSTPAPTENKGGNE